MLIDEDWFGLDNGMIRPLLGESGRFGPCMGAGYRNGSLSPQDGRDANLGQVVTTIEQAETTGSYWGLDSSLGNDIFGGLESSFGNGTFSGLESSFGKGTFSIIISFCTGLFVSVSMTTSFGP